MSNLWSKLSATDIRVSSSILHSDACKTYHILGTECTFSATQHDHVAFQTLTTQCRVPPFHTGQKRMLVDLSEGSWGQNATTCHIHQMRDATTVVRDGISHPQSMYIPLHHMHLTEETTTTEYTKLHGNCAVCSKKTLSNKPNLQPTESHCTAICGRRCTMVTGPRGLFRSRVANADYAAEDADG
jgi:hypothetical protein